MTPPETGFGGELRKEEDADEKEGHGLMRERSGQESCSG